MKDFGDLMKQAQQCRRLCRTQARQQMEVQGESGAGMVKVVMNGRYEVKVLYWTRRCCLKIKCWGSLAAACNDTVQSRTGAE